MAVAGNLSDLSKVHPSGPAALYSQEDVPVPETEPEDVAQQEDVSDSQAVAQEGELQSVRKELEAESSVTQPQEVVADSHVVIQEGEPQSARMELEVEGSHSQPVSADADPRDELLCAQQEIAALKQEVQSLQAELAEERAKAARVAELQRHRRERALRREHLRNNLGPWLCRPWPPVSPAVPEFEPLSRLELSDDHRRCRNASGGDERILAVARQGLSAGRHQFTVHIISLKRDFYVGVATTNTPRDQHARRHGLFLSRYGNLRWNDSKRVYSLIGFHAGDRITMRLDFPTRTAAFEVNGYDWGTVQGAPLPEGPLYPAIIFHSSDDEAEFVAPSIWRLGITRP